MLEDFTDTVNGYGSEEEDDDEEEEEISAPVVTPARRVASKIESVESTTTRFGRFISPLAFNKISETLGKLLNCFWNIENSVKFFGYKF